MKILIVEDNEMNRDMLSRRLIKKGFEIIIAVDGEEGVKKTLNEKPDLILMDMSLPVMDGWEATKKLKSNSDTSKIPIIALPLIVRFSHPKYCINDCPFFSALT